MLLSSIGHLLLFPAGSFLVILLITALLVCITPRQKKDQVVGPPEKINIAYATAPNAILTYIALAKSCFVEEGLDVTPQPRWALKKRLTTYKDMLKYIYFVYAGGLLAVKHEAVRILR